MIKLIFPLIVLVTYNEWFLRTYEMQSIYPFNGTRVSTLEAGDARLTEVVLNTPDGAELILWVSTPAPGHPTFMYLPGNAGNLASRVHRFSHFVDEGYGVVALGYRGSSGSSGKPSEEALSRDGLLVFDTVAELIGETGGQVILYGESLGTAVATKIAASRVAHAIILEAPFTSIPDLARQQYPDINLEDILTQFWDTAARIGAVKEPLLILHGTEDELVPFEHGQTIFRLAGSAQKWIEPLEGVGHRGIWTDGAMKALYDFMDRL